MRLINDYTPQSTEDLERLKSDLGCTGNQMADLAGVASGANIPVGSSPGPMSPRILFFMAAQLALNESEIDRVMKKMNEIGADF